MSCSLLLDVAVQQQKCNLLAVKLWSGHSSLDKFYIRVVFYGRDKPARLRNRTVFLPLTELPKDVSVDLDSDHDYETVDEALVTIVRKAQEDALHYWK